MRLSTSVMSSHMGERKHSFIGVAGGRWACFAALLALALLCSPLRAADLPLVKGDVLVITGDSIITQYMWTSYLHSYLVLMNPKLDLKVATVGRSGVTLGYWLDGSGPEYEMYMKGIYSLEPKYVFVGPSDNGGYSPEKTQAFLQDLVDNYVVKRSHATPVIYGIMPAVGSRGQQYGTPYDAAVEAVAKSATPNWPYSKTYGATEAAYRWNRKFTAALDGTLTSPGHGFTNGMPVMFELSGNPAGPTGISAGVIYYVRDAAADTFKVSATAGGDAVRILTVGSGTNFVSKNWPLLRRPDFITDGEHPYICGHIGYCVKLIQGLGWTTTVSTATVAADKRAVTSSDHCTIGPVTGNGFGGIDFTRLDERLPWAIDEEGRAGALKVFPEIAGWQKYTLTVTGLAAGKYDVLIDGVNVGTVSDAELAAGWNMADLTTGPVHEKGQNVLNAIRDLQWLSRTYPFVDKGARPKNREGVAMYGSYINGQYRAGKRGKDLIDSVAAAIASMDGYHQLIWKAAQPEKLTFSLRLQQAGAKTAP